MLMIREKALEETKKPSHYVTKEFLRINIFGITAIVSRHKNCQHLVEIILGRKVNALPSLKVLVHLWPNKYAPCRLKLMLSTPVWLIIGNQLKWQTMQTVKLPTATRLFCRNFYISSLIVWRSLVDRVIFKGFIGFKRRTHYRNQCSSLTLF